MCFFNFGLHCVELIHVPVQASKNGARLEVESRRMILAVVQMQTSQPFALVLCQIVDYYLYIAYQSFCLY